VDYSARDGILRASERLPASEPVSRERFSKMLAEVNHSRAAVGEVDLLIRTGGEQRLSDFLLWECAYAELLFLPKMWPDFSSADLEAAVRDFQSRNRRFGGLPWPRPDPLCRQACPAPRRPSPRRFSSVS